MQLGYLQRKQQEKFRLGVGGKEGAEEGDPRRTSRVGVLILGFRTCLSFPQARRIVRHNGLQNTDTWRGHTQPHAAKPRRPRLPSPFLLFVGCNFKILPPPPPPLSRSLLAPSLLPGLPTSHLPPPPKTASPGSDQPDQHVIEIVSLFNFDLLPCHRWQDPESWLVSLQLA